MFRFEVSGDTKRLERFLQQGSRFDIRPFLEEGGREGVAALREATPTDTGLARSNWYYQVSVKNDVYQVDWLNGNLEEGYKVIISLQYGHATGTGGYVQGRDIINPAMKPIFDRIADNVWKAVKSL